MCAIILKCEINILKQKCTAAGGLKVETYHTAFCNLSKRSRTRGKQHTLICRHQFVEL